MNDPEILDRILENCSLRFRSVICPNKDRVAHIAAVKVQADAEWTVTDCSLLPNGKVNCAMTCLLRNFESGESSF